MRIVRPWLFGFASILVAATALAQVSSAVGPDLPPAPHVDDPRLVPLVPPARVIASWTEVLSLVRARSTDLKIAYDEVTRAEAQTRVALAGALPSLTGQGIANHDFLHGTTVELYSSTQLVPVQTPTANTLSLQAALVQPLFAPRAWHQIGTQLRIEDAARLSAEDRKRTLAIDVASAVVGELTAERITELNRVGLRQALERLALAVRREEIGSGTKLDILRASADVDAARASLVAGDEAARQAREALGLALGLPMQVGIARSLDMNGLVIDTGTGCRVLPSLASRRDILAAREQVEIARRNVTDAKEQFLPTANLQSTFYATTDDLVIPKATWNVQAVLTVPLWDGGARYGFLKDARAQQDEWGQRLEAQWRAATVEIEQTRRAVAVAEDALRVATDAEDHAARIDTLTQKGFMTGQGTSLDLVISAAALRQAQINKALREFELVRARIQAVLALADCHW
jgi:outer membrane protein TolC